MHDHQMPEEGSGFFEERMESAMPQADPQFREQLRVQLMDQLRQEEAMRVIWNRPRVRRLAAFAALALIVLTLALTPAGRALAETLLELGPFRFTDDPTIVEETIEQNPERLTPSEDAAEREAVRVREKAFESAAEASTEAGFPVLYPEYVPDGYHVSGRGPVTVLYNSQGEPTQATGDFTTPEYEYILSYRQIPYTPDPERDPYDVGIGAAEVQPVTVNGGEGVFFKDLKWGSRLDEEGQPVAVPYNVLIWIQEIDGQQFEFWLYSGERLPQSEMLAVAESMAP